MNITKIAVGIDFSERSNVALGQAIALARKHGADVVLLHACTVPVRPAHLPNSMLGAAAHFQQLAIQQLDVKRKRLEELRQRHSDGSVTLSHMITDGFADAALARAATELGADLLVVGTHGRRGVERFLLGSVAERTVRLSKANVMVARPGSSKARGYHRILVPVDFSDISDEVVSTAVTIAAPRAVIETFHTWSIPGAGWFSYDVAHGTGGAVREETASAAAAAARALVARHPVPDGTTLTFALVEDAAAHGIHERLESGDYDLVVVGSHGRRGWRRFMLGSVAEATVRYAPCSVVVVHPSEAGERT